VRDVAEPFCCECIAIVSIAVAVRTIKRQKANRRGPQRVTVASSLLDGRE
jgi:hypothetical protein